MQSNIIALQLELRMHGTQQVSICDAKQQMQDFKALIVALSQERTVHLKQK